ncbi:MAG TPA: AAA family ATPase [Hyphomicrobiaceae bacterium]|jgi:adenylate kinase family enzyme
MRTCRLHITGASGAGVTTLGRALADTLAISHHDTDDYFWQPTSPPYRDKRAIADRLRLMRELFLDRAEWVLSGSLDGWGDPLIPLLDLVVFVFVRPEVRLQRLREREARRFGADAIAVGGWRHPEAEDFFDWAARYDDDTRVGRNLKRHEAWLAGLPCRVIRTDGARATRELVTQVLAEIDRPR